MQIYLIKYKYFHKYQIFFIEFKYILLNKNFIFAIFQQQETTSWLVCFFVCVSFQTRTNLTLIKFYKAVV